jgi:hypothetical protein
MVEAMSISGELRRIRKSYFVGACYMAVLLDAIIVAG